MSKIHWRVGGGVMVNIAYYRHKRRKEKRISRAELYELRRSNGKN